MTEKAAPDEGHRQPTLKEIAESTGTHNVQPLSEIQDPMSSEAEKGAAEAGGGDTSEGARKPPPLEKAKSLVREVGSMCVCVCVSMSVCVVLCCVWGEGGDTCAHVCVFVCRRLRSCVCLCEGFCLCFCVYVCVWGYLRSYVCVCVTVWEFLPVLLCVCVGACALCVSFWEFMSVLLCVCVYQKKSISAVSVAWTVQLMGVLTVE